MAEQQGGKNIVLCLDGTGNEFSESNSNVVKLYTCLTEGPEQRTYYHPGVGTMGDQRATTWLGRQLSRLLGLAIGAGFTDNVADAYKFLMDHYCDGDRIWLFGFSRGSYTVRALAGALDMYGLLCPGNEGHLPYLLRMFSSASHQAFNKQKRRAPGTARRIPDDRLSEAFRSTFSREVPIYFIGIMDTVSSIGWITDPVKLLYDAKNPIVRKGRHAVSLDERRCFYQANLWGHPMTASALRPLTQAMVGGDPKQDIVQAWFPGAHSDVGGSYPQDECAPAMEAFKWILSEAEMDGNLCINDEKKKAIFGDSSTKYKDILSYNKAPEADVRLHKSLCHAWWLLELFPHKYFDENGNLKWRLAPWPHRREVPDGALIHPKLRDWLGKKDYAPKNLREDWVVDLRASPSGDLIPSVQQRLIGENYGIYKPQKRARASGAATATRMAMLVTLGVGAAFLLKRKL